MSAGTGLWYIGILFQVIATFCATSGKVLIRVSEVRSEEHPRLAKWIFRLGIVVNTVGAPAFETLAYTQAAQSLVAPLNGLDTVWNTILAPSLLGEKLTRRYIAGSIIVLIGTAGAGATGNHSDAEWTVDYAREIFITIRVLVYYLAFVVFFLVNRLFFMRWPKGHLVRGVSLSFTAGALAGNMVCTKAALGLIKHSIFAPDLSVWENWMVYAFMIGGLFFAVNNVFYMMQGLAEFEALFMITIYVGGQIISGALSGSIVLLDNAGLEAWRLSLYVLSIVTIVLGMYIVATTLKVSEDKAPRESSKSPLSPRSKDGESVWEARPCQIPPVPWTPSQPHVIGSSPEAVEVKEAAPPV